MLIAQAQQAISSLVRDLERIDQRLAKIAHSLPRPQFSAGTDEPINVEGAVYAAITNTQQDDLAAVIHTLRETSKITLQDIRDEEKAPSEIVFRQQAQNQGRSPSHQELFS